MFAAFFRNWLRDQAETHALELSRRADSPAGPPRIAAKLENVSPAFLLVMIDPSEAQDGAHEEIPSGTFTARGNSTLEVKAQTRALRVK